MRCEAYGCRNNDGGYCMCASYVVIEEDGTCSEIDAKIEEGEEDA